MASTCVAHAWGVASTCLASIWVAHAWGMASTCLASTDTCSGLLVIKCAWDRVRKYVESQWGKVRILFVLRCSSIRFKDSTCGNGAGMIRVGSLFV